MLLLATFYSCLLFHSCSRRMLFVFFQRPPCFSVSSLNAVRSPNFWLEFDSFCKATWVLRACLSLLPCQKHVGFVSAVVRYRSPNLTQKCCMDWYTGPLKCSVSALWLHLILRSSEPSTENTCKWILLALFLTCLAAFLTLAGSDFSRSGMG